MIFAKMRFLRKINFKKVITHNFWLKIISLVVAIIIWLYISGEIIKGVSSI